MAVLGYIIGREVSKHVLIALAWTQNCLQSSETYLNRRKLSMKDKNGDEIVRVERCANRKCRKPYSEEDFYPNQLICKKCKQTKNRMRLTQKKIEECRVKCQKCGCTNKPSLMFLTSKPIHTYVTIEDLKKLPLLCMNCIISNQFR